ncbi:HIT domain-containing protein [Chloroflexota bacterium]
MERIWAPWRMPYIELTKEGEKGCFLCDKPAENNDTENHILYRGEKNYIIMNLYPYNPGHLLVAPYRHISVLEGLTDEERNEHFAVVCRGVNLLKQVMNPEGFNIGINAGRIAGAGVDDHVHTHIVPRWAGDTNFMPVLTDIRVVPQAMAETYTKLMERV